MGEMLADVEQTDWANAVRLEFPIFEGGGTHVNVSGVAMTAAAPHPENALAFMEFLTSPEAQEIYAEANHENGKKLLHEMDYSFIFPRVVIRIAYF